MSTAPASAAPLDVESLRADFPILHERLPGDRPLVYLDNAASTQRPRQVIQAIVDCYERNYANVHRGIHWLSERSTDLFEASREVMRAFLGARSTDEIIFTHGTTESINLVARSWGDANVAAGDEIVLTELEHHSNLVPWQQLAARRGAALRYVPITDNGQLDLQAFDALLGPRTRLVAIAAVSNVLGTINPIDEITRRAHQHGALVLIDAAQSAPHLPIDVKQIDCDFLAFSGHKMLGPSGVGVLYGRREILEAMPPFLGGGSMIRRVRLDGFEPADLPARCEAGTPAIAPVIALATAVHYLERVGLTAVHAHERLLAERAHAVLADVGGVRIFGPSPEQKAGVVSFTVEGIHAHDVAQLLDRAGVAVRAGHHCAMPLHKRLGVPATTRASFYLYNTLAEVDRLGEALRDAKRVFRRK